IGIDGHRLHYTSNVLEKGVDPTKARVIPRDIVALALKLQRKGNIQVVFNTPSLAVENEGTVARNRRQLGERRVELRLSGGAILRTHLLEGIFPDVLRVIPHGGNSKEYKTAEIGAHKVADLN